jgi:hypothetical protein
MLPEVLTLTHHHIKEIVGLTTITVSLTLDGTVVNLTSASGSLTLSQQITDETLILTDGGDVAVENCLNLVRDIVSTGAAGMGNRLF